MCNGLAVGQCRWTLEGNCLPCVPRTSSLPPPPLLIARATLRMVCDVFSWGHFLHVGPLSYLSDSRTYCVTARVPDFAASDTVISGLNDIWALCEEMSQLRRVTLVSRWVTAMSARSELFVFVVWSFPGREHDRQVAFIWSTASESTVVLSVVAIVVGLRDHLVFALRQGILRGLETLWFSSLFLSSFTRLFFAPFCSPSSQQVQHGRLPKERADACRQWARACLGDLKQGYSSDVRVVLPSRFNTPGFLERFDSVVYSYSHRLKSEGQVELVFTCFSSASSPHRGM